MEKVWGWECSVKRNRSGFTHCSFAVGYIVSYSLNLALKSQVCRVLLPSSMSRSMPTPTIYACTPHSQCCNVVHAPKNQTQRDYPDIPVNQMKTSDGGLDSQDNGVPTLKGWLTTWQGEREKREKSNTKDIIDIELGESESKLTQGNCQTSTSLHLRQTDNPEIVKFPLHKIFPQKTIGPCGMIPY